MLRSDRTLLAIIVGLVVLVVAAFVILLRQPSLSYMGDQTAAGAANDYVLALSRGDMAKAYGLLADDLPARPKNLDEFIRDVDEQPWTFGNQDQPATLRVLSTEPSTDDTGVEMAAVVVERTAFMERGLLDNGTSSMTAKLRLRRVRDGTWRITGGDRFLHPCWLDREDCYRTFKAPGAEEAP
jgi:hypothetical protein